jgi:hypothetical protein
MKTIIELLIINKAYKSKDNFFNLSCVVTIEEIPIIIAIINVNLLPYIY